MARGNFSNGDAGISGFVKDSGFLGCVDVGIWDSCRCLGIKDFLHLDFSKNEIFFCLIEHGPMSYVEVLKYNFFVCIFCFLAP